MTRRNTQSLTHLGVDEVIWNSEQQDNLPVGTVIVETRNERSHWRKGEDLLWHGEGSNSGRGQGYRSDQFSQGGYNKVLSLPEGYVQPPPPPPDTLMQYMWRFRVNALAGAVENSVSLDAARKGLRLLHIPDEFEMGPGVWLNTYDNDTRVPVGTLCCNRGSEDPKNPRFTVMKYDGRRGWRNVGLGTVGMQRELTILEVPGVTETPAWVAERGNEQTAQEVAEFKARAWRIGLQIKGEQSWCGTYENVIARVGVTRESLTAVKTQGLSIGDRVQPSQVSSFPNGTLFLFHSDDDRSRWAIYNRDDAANNSTRTLRLAGHRGQSARPLGNYATGMSVLSVPIEGEQPWTLPQGIGATQVIDLLHPGSMFGYGGSFYSKCRDGLWRSTTRNDRTIHDEGRYEANVFGNYPINLHHFTSEELA